MVIKYDKLISRSVKEAKDSVLEGLKTLLTANIKRTSEGNRLFASTKEVMEHNIDYSWDPLSKKKNDIVEKYYKEYLDTTSTITEEDLYLNQLLAVVNILHIIDTEKDETISINELKEHIMYHNDSCLNLLMLCAKLLIKYCVERQNIESINENDIPENTNLLSFFEGYILEYNDSHFKNAHRCLTDEEIYDPKKKDLPYQDVKMFKVNHLLNTGELPSPEKVIGTGFRFTKQSLSTEKNDIMSFVYKTFYWIKDFFTSMFVNIWKNTLGNSEDQEGDVSDQTNTKDILNKGFLDDKSHFLDATCPL